MTFTGVTALEAFHPTTLASAQSPGQGVMYWSRAALRGFEDHTWPSLGKVINFNKPSNLRY